MKNWTKKSERFLEMARECGFSTTTAEYAFNDSMVIALCNRVRDEALEEAGVIADTTVGPSNEIRALKEK